MPATSATWKRCSAALAQRLGFRVAPGLSERVIYRELFLKGLTLLDLRKSSGLAYDHVACRGASGSCGPCWNELNLPPLAVAAG